MRGIFWYFNIFALISIAWVKSTPFLTFTTYWKGTIMSWKYCISLSFIFSHGRYLHVIECCEHWQSVLRCIYSVSYLLKIFHTCFFTTALFSVKVINLSLHKFVNLFQTCFLFLSVEIFHRKIAQKILQFFNYCYFI